MKKKLDRDCSCRVVEPTATLGDNRFGWVGVMAVDDLVELESQLSQLIANLEALAALHSDDPEDGSKLKAARAAAERAHTVVKRQLRDLKGGN